MDNVGESETIQNSEASVTFGSTRESVINHMNENQYAKGLIGLLTSKMENWNSDLDPRATESRAVADKIPALINWLVYSSDFVNLAEINGYLESRIKNHIDILTQRFIVRPNESAIGQLSLGYRQAMDALIKTVAPFIESQKQDPIQNELTIWSHTNGTDGNFPLRQPENLRIDHNLQRVELGMFVFYVPEAQKDRISAFGMLAQQMESVIGIKAGERKRVHILLVPGSEFCPRGGFASSDGRRIIIDVNHPDNFRVFAHEYVHTFLGQTLGSSKSAAAMEGAAVFFARQRFPLDPRNDYGSNFLWGFTDIVDLNQKYIEIGLSHTQMLEKVGKSDLTAQEKYEYAYKFGGFLAEYIITNFGKEKFLEYYQKTCQDNFFNSTTGRQLIKDGVCVVGEREVVEQALRSVGLNPDLIRKDFDSFIKQRTIK